MSKLIRANFGRIKKDLVFWVCMAGMCIAGVFVSLKAEVALERVFFVYTLLVGVASAVFCGLFLGTEHGDGTLRNKLIVGHTKAAVYGADLIVSVLAGFLFCGAYLVPMLAIGIPRLGLFELEPASVLALFGVSLALSAAFSGVFTLISMVGQNKAAVAVLCILCCFAMLLLGVVVKSRLDEPEFYDGYTYTDSLGTSVASSEPNENYIQPEQRPFWQFVLDFLPAGQAVQFADLSFVRLWPLPLYSLLVFALTGAVGVLVFRRENIK